MKVRPALRPSKTCASTDAFAEALYAPSQSPYTIDKDSTIYPIYPKPNTHNLNVGTYNPKIVGFILGALIKA